LKKESGYEEKKKRKFLPQKKAHKEKKSVRKARRSIEGDTDLIERYQTKGGIT